MSSEKSIKQMESEELSKLEYSAKRKVARESARERIRLGLKYGDVDFKSLQGEKLTELKKREKKEKTFQGIKEGIKKGFNKLFIKNQGERGRISKSFLKGKVDLSSHRMNLTSDQQPKKRMRFI